MKIENPVWVFFRKVVTTFKKRFNFGFWAQKFFRWKKKICINICLTRDNFTTPQKGIFNIKYKLTNIWKLPQIIWIPKWHLTKQVWSLLWEINKLDNTIRSSLNGFLCYSWFHTKYYHNRSMFDDRNVIPCIKYFLLYKILIRW